MQPKIARAAHVTAPNGDVFEKRLVRHNDGKVSIGRKKIACGIRNQEPQPTKIVIIPNKEAMPLSKTAKRRVIKLEKDAKSAARKKTAAPVTTRERFHHETKKFDGSDYVSEIKPAYLQTTSRLTPILRKMEARNGSHIEQFQRDFETVTSSLRSVNMDGARGGKGLPIPLVQIQAQDRLKELEEDFPQSFLLCKLIIVDSVDPKVIPVPDKMKKKGGIKKMVQNAVDDLARFYTPRKTRPDQRLAAFAKEIEEQRRRYDRRG